MVKYVHVKYPVRMSEKEKKEIREKVEYEIQRADELEMLIEHNIIEIEDEMLKFQDEIERFAEMKREAEDDYFDFEDEVYYDMEEIDAM